MRKDGIQTRKRKPKNPAGNTAGGSGGKKDGEGKGKQENMAGKSADICGITLGPMQGGHFCLAIVVVFAVDCPDIVYTIAEQASYTLR